MAINKDQITQDFVNLCKDMINENAYNYDKVGRLEIIDFYPDNKELLKIVITKHTVDIFS